MSALAQEQRIQNVIAFGACIVSLAVLGLAFNGILVSPIAALREASLNDPVARNAGLQGVIRGASSAACWAGAGVAIGAVLCIFGGRIEAVGKGTNAGAAVVVAATAFLVFMAAG
jgi:hypothetical protein